MRVAYYSPMPPERSGIADYSAHLLPALRERIEVVVAQRRRRAPRAELALYHLARLLPVRLRHHQLPRPAAHRPAALAVEQEIGDQGAARRRLAGSRAGRRPEHGRGGS